jgi:hypothetical protein
MTISKWYFGWIGFVTGPMTHMCNTAKLGPKLLVLVKLTLTLVVLLVLKRNSFCWFAYITTSLSPHQNKFAVTLAIFLSIPSGVCLQTEPC